MRTTIEFSIDELVLQGFDGAHRDVVARALKRELAGLLEEEGLPLALTRQTDRPTVDAGGIVWSPAAPPALLGIEIAKAMYRGLGR